MNAKNTTCTISWELFLYIYLFLIKLFSFHLHMDNGYTITFSNDNKTTEHTGWTSLEVLKAETIPHKRV